MAQTGLRMMPTSPLPPLKSRTVGFPQYGFKASMSDRAFLNGVSVKPAPGIPSLPFSLLPSFARVLLRGRPGSVSRSTQASTCRCAGELLLPTPGALGSGPSYVVSIHHCLIRPHAPVPQARCDFAFTLIRNAFAVRERLGDPRDLPYFRLPYFPYMPSTLPRWSTVPSRVILTRRFQASSNSYRVANHYLPPLPAIPDGAFYFGAASFSLFSRPACLPSPPGWLRQDETTYLSPCLLRYLVTPAFGAVRHRTALGIRLDGRTGNLPSSGLSPDKLRQLVRLHTNICCEPGGAAFLSWRMVISRV